MESALHLKLKKALAEMLFLSVLSEQPRPILEVAEILAQRSNGVCSMKFPYAIVYRMVDNGYIKELGARQTIDRKREFYALTAEGQRYLETLKEEYAFFEKAVKQVIDH